MKNLTSPKIVVSAPCDGRCCTGGKLNKCKKKQNKCIHLPS